MSLARVKTWVSSEVLYASDLNAEFNSILNNALSLISPLTGNLNFNSNQATNLVLERLASNPTAATQGRVWYDTTNNDLRADTSSAIKIIGPHVLSGSRGLSGANNSGAPTTQFDLTADLVLLRSSSTGSAFVHTSPGTITCNTATAGPAANGRDQSAVFNASSWIHFYWIYDGTTLASIASTTAPPTGPTLPTGYTHWAYAGPIRYNASTQLVTQYLRGNKASYKTPSTDAGILTGGTAISTTQVTLTAHVPSNASEFSFVGVSVVPAGAGIGTYFVYLGVDNTLTSTAWLTEIQVDSQVAAQESRGGLYEFTFPNVSQGLWYMNSSASVQCTLFLRDYTIPNGGV